MTDTEKEQIYENIKAKLFQSNKNEIEDKIDIILDELAAQSGRSMIIMGCAFLEELCKNCVFETMTDKGKAEFKKRQGKEFTFSYATTILYAQDYFSEEIFKLFNLIRDIRNKYAHIPLMENNHIESIKNKNEKIREILKNRWVTRKMDLLRKIVDVDSQLYYIVFENLIYGLTALEMFIIPNQKLSKLQFVTNENFLRISIFISEINEHTESYFDSKI